MRVLVIEDDYRIGDFLVRALTPEGHSCTHVTNGKEAVKIGREGDFDIMLLDLMLPGLSGLEVCQELRFRNVRTPIIMLTAVDSVEDIVTGLRMGADDYMTKPFDIDELLARMETVCRRSVALDSQIPVLSVGDVSMNTISKLVSVSGETVSLTAKELAILELLLSNPDRLFSRERILNNIWGTNADPMTNVVDVYIGRLRKKLGKEKTPFIETVRGMGYRIDPLCGSDNQTSDD